MEWLTDKNGKKYYIDSFGIKTYEMQVCIDGIYIPESQVEEFNKRKRENMAAYYKAINEKPQPKTCPFKNGINRYCTGKKCALYTDDHCSLSTLSDTADRYTKGLWCPLRNEPCIEDCVLYSDGCIITGRKKNE